MTPIRFTPPANGGTTTAKLPVPLGSICSGGRYDNLAALYTKQQLPGIGASLGLDRLLAALEERLRRAGAFASLEAPPLSGRRSP